MQLCQLNLIADQLIRQDVCGGYPNQDLLRSLAVCVYCALSQAINHTIGKRYSSSMRQPHSLGTETT